MPKTAVAICLTILVAATSAARHSAPHAATNGALSGKVIDGATGSALNGASVAVRGTALRGSSDGNGIFFIDDVPLGTVALQVSRAGYKTRELNVSVTPDDPTQWTIALAKLKR